MGTPLRLLFIEDSPDDVELICLELKKAGFDVDCQRVETEDTFVSALRDDEWDLLISDFRMPQFDGLRAFSLFKEMDLDIPFIFVSGALGEERAVEAMRAGARDYLLKDNLTRLTVAVKRELEEAKNRRIRREAEASARREQRRLAMAVQASGVGVFEHTIPLSAEPYFNDRCCEILGHERSEIPPATGLLSWIRTQVHADDWATAERAFEAFASGRHERLQVELRVQHKTGLWLSMVAFANCIERDHRGRPTQAVGVVLDLAERKQLENQLRQAQKMEAVGRLAGGVAHDFNNLLTAIFSFGNFVLDELNPKDAAFQDMKEVLQAARRAESLTGQLLAFSRRHTVAPRVVNLTDTIQNTEKMLRRLLGEDIEFLTNLTTALWNVRIDPDVFEQVLVNLAVNSRDAMPNGGRLTIETANVTLDEAYAQAHAADVPAGDYVMTAISDTGGGMDDATQAKIFEPFFTTKDPSKGTGLGLSTCYGIVKQAGGYIWVYSEPEQGTTFKIYLPRIMDRTDTLTKQVEPSTLRGTELVLVVEDDVQVRRISVRTLGRLGYRVLEAAHADQAVQTYEQLGEPIDLLLTDVVMPGMNGKQLAEHLKGRQPHLKVLYTSGYTANAVVHRGVLTPDAHMLQKPFGPNALAQKVRALLDEEN